jgi:hypothetical protein
MKTFLFILIMTVPLLAQQDSLKAASQNPSPMVEYTRSHERIAQKTFKGLDVIIKDLFSGPIEIYIPGKSLGFNQFDLLIHFHGSSNIVKYAADKYEGNIIAVDINLGAGSSRYYKEFADSTLFINLLDSVRNLSKRLNHNITIRHIILSGFSAGYGAIKKILEFKSLYNLTDAVLLLDGLHAGYIPDRRVLSEGGHIDSSAYKFFIKLAKDASEKKSRKKFLITHSEIFPGTFVSTTESTDYILNILGLKRKAVLKWGPLGMQQLSEAGKNHFMILGFAGNTAPDHIDHFHSLYYFLNKLMKL